MTVFAIQQVAHDEKRGHELFHTTLCLDELKQLMLQVAAAINRTPCAALENAVTKKRYRRTP